MSFYILFILLLKFPQAPGGQAYYFNAQTHESTYVRPIPAFPVIPIIQSEPRKKKEKPLTKTPIPGTEWLRVKTTEGNVFYSHKVKKESFWTVPDEIKEAVEKLNNDDLGKQEGAAKAVADDALKDERERSMEVQRIREEVQAMVKRKAEDNNSLDEMVVTKKTKTEEEADGESDESEEEDWEREAAAQLAAEAEAEKIRQEEEAERLKEAEAEMKRSAQLKMPERVDLSTEEAKALFKVSISVAFMS